VGLALKRGDAPRGILICGSGVGVCVAANKIPGIRAGMCHDTYSAHQGVEHDDMNVIVLGARIIGSALAFEVVDAFVGANSSPGRAVSRRFKKVLAIEAKYQCGDGSGEPGLEASIGKSAAGSRFVGLNRRSTFAGSWFNQLHQGFITAQHTERRRCSPST
jgi:hypothetical protein